MGEQISSKIMELFTLIKTIANPIGIVAVALCGLYLLFGSDPTTIRKVKTWGISIFIGLLVINMAQSIVQWIQGLA